MPAELGSWLRAQRQARGWNASEMARQLRRAATASGDILPGNQTLFTYLRRWEHGHIAPSERYALHYCTALGIDPARFGPPATPWSRPVDAALSGSPDVAYREAQETPSTGSWIEREVLMTAHEGSDHAERAERRDIGEATLAQLRADLVRLSHDYMSDEPLPLFLEMRRVRTRIYAALDRQLWPRDQTELYFQLAVLNCLMAVAADDLGYQQAAEELVRAGWAYATAIGHRPLLAHLRLELAGIVFWDRPRQSLELAQSGLAYLSDGPNAAQLQLQSARAAARLGDTATARRAITSAAEARERAHHDDLLEIGGEFRLSRASHHYMAGAAVIEIPDAQADAVTELEHAAGLYAAGPEPGEDHGFGLEALAYVDLAAALLRADRLDSATSALAPVLLLPQGKRIKNLPERLTRVRAELAGPRYQGSPQARDLDEQIEEFGRDTIVAALRELPG
jgi:transcriptional regulator with XRE-family HTH domain